MDKNLKDQDILLVKEKGKNELQAAKMGEDGKLKKVKPDNPDNPDFLKIDKNGNILENFFENFKRQAKNPTQFEFFRVPAEKFQEVVQKLQDAFKHPDKPQNREFIDLHRVNPETFLKQREQQPNEASQQYPSSQQSQSSPSYYTIDASRVDWSQFESIGITRETLEKTGNLEKLLNWQKTDLLPINPKIDEITFRTDARLSMRESPDGKMSMAIHALRKEPELERPYFGIRFSDEDKQNLLKTGNLGRIAETEYKPGVKTPVFISIDKQTNELVAFRAEKMKIPENIKGVNLNEQQKKELSQGKAVWIEGMTSKTGKDFSAYLQFNADKRSFEFRFDNEKK